ncbi:MAG: hypothetical protein IT440_10600 [Phycisphaeraceae bacterium]|nr:hypothetical protein [Phycisphaeraceae bacterium]
MSLTRDAVYAAAALATSPVWAWKLWRTGKWKTDWPSRFGHAPAIPHDKPTLLLHAVSVGEVNAIRQLVKLLHEQTSGSWRIVVSTTTDTGLARAKQCFEPQHTVVRYPLDFTRGVRRFLDAIQPDLVALVELEVWPNFVEQCSLRGIPVCVVNGRLSQRSFKGYRKIAPLIRSTFARLSLAAVQSRDIAERFIAVGVPRDRVTVADTMKWDTAQVADEVPGSEQLAAEMGIDRSKPLIVAGSTGPGEEAMLIRDCPAEAQLMLVPRKPERFEEVAALDAGMVRRTQPGKVKPGRLFLLDTMGELRKAYALADVVIVGRSFLGLYGSDMMEPIALGKPTIIGPCHSDFADIMEALAAGRGIEVTNSPGETVRRLLADRTAAGDMARRGRDVILSRQGATQRHADLLCKLMPG